MLDDGRRPRTFAVTPPGTDPAPASQRGASRHLGKPAIRPSVKWPVDKTGWFRGGARVCRNAPRTHPAWRHFQYPLLVALAFTVAGVGAASLPLDGHEVFVAQTAQEMLQRGDWLTPYFNGEPRLTKPPLNYWLTGLFAWLSGAGRVLPEHARAVSVLAGTGLCALTLTGGRLLFPQQAPIATIAALFLASSAGFFTFTHDARPDMLYSLLCMGGVTAFLSAWRRRERGEPAGWPSCLSWVCYGLATLSKGPHMPALFLLACAAFAFYARLPWRKWGELFRPLSGIALFAAIALPWWWLLRKEVGERVFAASQLSGTLLTGQGEHLFTPYYFYRFMPLAAPWLAPLLAALWGIRFRRPAPETALLLLLTLIPAFALGCGAQQRPVYILPVLPWLFLLLAKFAAIPTSAASGRVLAWAIPGQWLLIMMGGGWLWYQADAAARAAIPVLPFLAACGIAWFACLIWRRWRNLDTRTDIAASAVLLCLSYVLAGATPLAWGEERFARLHLQAALEQIGETRIPIVTLNGASDDVFIYFAKRRIESVSGLTGLAQYLQKSGELAVIARPGIQAQFPPEWKAEILAAMPPIKGSRGLFLLHGTK